MVNLVPQQEDFIRYKDSGGPNLCPSDQYRYKGKQIGSKYEALRKGFQETAGHCSGR